MITLTFYSGWLVGCLTMLAVLPLRRPTPAPTYIAPLPRMAVATKWRKDHP